MSVDSSWQSVSTDDFWDLGAINFNFVWNTKLLPKISFVPKLSGSLTCLLIVEYSLISSTCFGSGNETKFQFGIHKILQPSYKYCFWYCSKMYRREYSSQLFQAYHFGEWHFLRVNSMRIHSSLKNVTWSTLETGIIL